MQVLGRPDGTVLQPSLISTYIQQIEMDVVGPLVKNS